MQIIKTNRLSENQRQELDALSESCRTVQPSCPSFPYEDVVSFYLLFDPQLVSALALIMPGLSESDEAAECIAITHPSVRNRGYFTALFDAAAEEIEDTDLLFLTDGRDEGALRTLDALGAELDFCEYKMELADLHPSKKQLLEIQPAETQPFKTSPSKLSVTKDLYCRIEEGPESTKTFLFYQDPSCTQQAAVCHTVSLSSTRACLYSFEVTEGLRGRGIGTEALSRIIASLGREGFSSLLLQVSGENETAVALYKKAGFRVSETLAYYLY